MTAAAIFAAMRTEFARFDATIDRLEAIVHQSTSAVADVPEKSVPSQRPPSDRGADPTSAGVTPPPAGVHHRETRP